VNTRADDKAMKRILIPGSLLLMMLPGISCGKKYYQLKDTNSQFYHIEDSTARVVDSDAVRLIRPYKQNLDSIVNEVLAVSDTEMTKGTPESLLGNFVADLVLKRALITYTQAIDFCLLNNGGLRSSLPAGKITVGKVYELMPFENEAVVLKLTGATVQELFDKIAKKGGEPISGARFTISNGRAEDIYINGSEFNPKRTYIMVTSDYLANGGEDLFFLKDALQNQMLGVKLRDLIISHLRAENSGGVSIKAALDERIKVK
jgi:2',3'-cyclic-nucleotide 2'-phosphodiesterase (5'-nucleotidase family)